MKLLLALGWIVYKTVRRAIMLQMSVENWVTAVRFELVYQRTWVQQHAPE